MLCPNQWSTLRSHRISSAARIWTHILTHQRPEVTATPNDQRDTVPLRGEREPWPERCRAVPRDQTELICALAVSRRTRCSLVFLGLSPGKAPAPLRGGSKDR